jgi:hypothetical protein
VPGTDSTPTAMPWQSSRRPPAECRLAALRAWVGLAALGGALAGCVTRSSVYFVPSAAQPRISSDELRDRADALLSSECERLMGDTQSAAGAADFRLTVDRGGAVTRADLTRSSRDQRIDAFFGGLVAQLKFDPPQSMAGETTTAYMTVGYSCSPTVQTSTVELKQR